MRKYRWLIAALLAAMLGLSACRAALPEENASAAEIVEGSAQGTEGGSLPQRVENEGSGTQTPGSSTQQPGSTTQQPGSSTQQSGSSTQPGNADTPGHADEPGNNNSTEENPMEKSYNLKLMAYNIRCADDPNGHSIDERAPRVKTVITQNNPDIVGMVEITPKWAAHLETEYQDQYRLLLHYRSEKNPEGLAILYKTAVFQFLDEGFFWLSETPEKESIGWDASLPRICTWVKLKHKETGKTIVYYNYHGEMADAFSAGAFQLISREMAKNPKAACFIGGDFNLFPTSLGYVSYFAAAMDEARNIVPKPATEPGTPTVPGGYPNPGAGDGEGDQIILDYIFHQEEKAQAVDYYVDRTRINGYFPSDHYAVVCCYQL